MGTRLLHRGRRFSCNIRNIIIVSPFFGAVLAGFIMGIILLIIGIEMIAAGIGGRDSSEATWVQKKHRIN